MNNQSNVDTRFTDVTIDPNLPTTVLHNFRSSKAATTIQQSVSSLINSTGDYLKAYPAVALGLTLAAGFAIGRVIRQQVEK